MKLLVCGGRDFENAQLVSEVLNPYLDKTLIIIQGGAKGADTLAWNWAVSNKVSWMTYPADWDKYGKRAGYIRNVQMLNESKPDLVIAFPGGKGTKMMINLAKAANVPVKEVQ